MFTKEILQEYIDKFDRNNRLTKEQIKIELNELYYKIRKETIKDCASWLTDFVHYEIELDYCEI